MLLGDVHTLFYHVPFPLKGRSQHAVIKLKVQGMTIMTKNLSSDWLTRFIKVIFLGSHWSEQFYSIGVQRLD